MEENVDVSSSADSSSANTETADPSQATTQPAQPAVQPKGFHEHPDWQRMVASRREDRGIIQQLQQRLQAQEQRSQQSQRADEPLTQEEQAAVVALKRLMARDPELKTALLAGQQLPQFHQRFQGIDQMQQQAAQAHTHAARSTIKELAAADKLPTDEASLRQITRLVAGEAMALENGQERYSSGDLSVLNEAFQNVKPFLATLRKPAEDSLIQTKNKLKQLPRPAQGSAAGQPAMPKPEPGKEREYEAKLHGLARKMLLEG